MSDLSKLVEIYETLSEEGKYLALSHASILCASEKLKEKNQRENEHAKSGKNGVAV